MEIFLTSKQYNKQFKEDAIKCYLEHKEWVKF